MSRKASSIALGDLLTWCCFLRRRRREWFDVDPLVRAWNVVEIREDGGDRLWALGPGLPFLSDACWNGIGPSDP